MRRHPNLGQAQTEFIVLAAVLLPMLWLFTLVYRYIDMMQATEQASRYVAFDGSTNIPETADQKTDAQLTTEIARRFFSRPATQLLRGEGVDAGEAELTPWWRDHLGRPLLNPAEKVGATVELQDFDAVPLLSSLAHSQFELERRRLAVGKVSVDPSNLPDLPPFDQLDLRFNRTTAILADPWAARRAGESERRFGNLTLYNPLGQTHIQTLRNFVGVLPAVISDPTFTGDGLFGAQAWELVPCDRLKEGC